MDGDHPCDAGMGERELGVDLEHGLEHQIGLLGDQGQLAVDGGLGAGDEIQDERLRVSGTPRVTHSPQDRVHREASSGSHLCPPPR